MAPVMLRLVFLRAGVAAVRLMNNGKVQDLSKMCYEFFLHLLVAQGDF